MWAIVAGITVLGPTAMLALHRVIAGGPAQRIAPADDKHDEQPRAGAPAEERAGFTAATFSGEPVELAEAFLLGEFDDDVGEDDGSGTTAASPSSGAPTAAGHLAAAPPPAPGTLRGGDPANPFSV